MIKKETEAYSYVVTRKLGDGKSGMVYDTMFEAKAKVEKLDAKKQTKGVYHVVTVPKLGRYYGV